MRYLRPPIHISLSFFSLVCVFLVILDKIEGLQNPYDVDTHLFEPASDIHVMGPTVFPSPTYKILPRGAVPIVEPAFGAHRPGADAVFAYFEGYTLQYFLSFVESLRDTGFDGDVVLAIAAKLLLNNGIWEYLTQQAHVVIYHSDLDCFDKKKAAPAPRTSTNGDLDPFQMCQLHHVYGWKSEDGSVTRTAPDPREPRVVATLRYEWYWIWLQRYNPNVWVMMLDARDAFFQRNPFADLPRQSDPHTRQGQLYFFGENINATRLGKSRKNANWLRNGYGNKVIASLQHKPTICSGGTMGEVVAVEQYLRALINEKDETAIKMTGADQGFHNYLYYSSKLQNAKAISSLTVWDQGRGIINNLGAMRVRPLSEWGIFNLTTGIVTNWDGRESPVFHQWDRDCDLYRHFDQSRFPHLRSEWQKKLGNLTRSVAST
jgi:hypothetical protein